MTIITMVVIKTQNQSFKSVWLEPAPSNSRVPGSNPAQALFVSIILAKLLQDMFTIMFNCYDTVAYKESLIKI